MKTTTILAVALCAGLLFGCDRIQSGQLPDSPKNTETAQDTESLKRLENAASAGDSEAMYSLFLAIARKGTDEHPISKEERKRAVQWLERAGKLENWRAAFVLALFYEHGTFGYPKSPKEQAYWSGIFEKNKPKNKEP